MQTRVLEKFKTYILNPVTFFFSKILSFFEITWKNNVEPDRLQMSTRLIRFACWIPKAINTHSQYSTHCFSTATMVARTLLNVTLYVNCLSCYTPDWGLVAKRLLFTELPYYVILFSLIRVTGSSHLKPPFPLPAVISLIIFTVECKL